MSSWEKKMERGGHWIAIFKNLTSQEALLWHSTWMNVDVNVYKGFRPSNAVTFILYCLHLVSYLYSFAPYQILWINNGLVIDIWFCVLTLRPNYFRQHHIQQKVNLQIVAYIWCKISGRHGDYMAWDLDAYPTVYVCRWCVFSCRPRTCVCHKKDWHPIHNILYLEPSASQNRHQAHRNPVLDQQYHQEWIGRKRISINMFYNMITLKRISPYS